MTNSDDEKRTQQSSKVPTENAQHEAANGEQSPQESLSADRSNHDKTRIVQKARQAQLEKTKVALKKTKTDSDKTRVAVPSRTKSTRNLKAEAQVDKTRIVKKSRPSTPDATRFKPITSRNQRSKGAPTASVNNSPPSKVDDQTSPSSDLLKERFVLEKVLGAGGMGVVYKAKDLVKVEAGDKDPYLAVKVLGDEFKEHPEAFIALQRESRKTQRIAHPNIVNVHDFDRDGDTVFMTMEYLEGQPLDELIRKYKSTGLPTEDAESILKSICRALIYAHKQNIIHSDFKPGNIFVTDNGDTKVFDFGIARAVAKAEHYEENLEDKTIFDAGDLGALTPAYASSEMLDGKEPDVRDDVYALGCVAYELFTGSHPFNKVPADEAKRQKLKPKRINHISRRQWKVIEKALAFDREDRIETVKEFLLQYSRKSAGIVLPILAVIVIVLSAAIYLQYFSNPENTISETEIRSELEFTLRMENYRNSIDDLVKSKAFTESWEANLWKQFQGVKVLLNSSEKWLNSTVNAEFEIFLRGNSKWYKETKLAIFNAYLVQIRQRRELGGLQKAQGLINNALKYSENSELLKQEQALLREAVAAAKIAAEEEAKRQQSLKDDEAKKRIIQNTAAKNNKVKRTAQQIRNDQFNIAMENVQTQLKCRANQIDTRNLDTAVKKLRSINKLKYQKQEKAIISLLVSCITNIGKVFPERATEYKKDALRLFSRNRDIAGIVIVPRDPCSRSLAGLGARGKRATCSDSLANLGSGPVLVVIPSTRGMSTFAIGKYELSIEEFNVFCKSSKRCKEIKSKDDKLPVANLPLSLVEQYLKWLSDKSKQKYRLPSLKEWQYASNAGRTSLDPNRNCQLNTRGISKGDNFERVSVGRQNKWGLVNYVGNASEWVYDKGRKLLAVGGGYNIPLEKCDVNTQSQHSGKADEVTGFRVLREVK